MPEVDARAFAAALEEFAGAEEAFDVNAAPVDIPEGVEARINRADDVVTEFCIQWLLGTLDAGPDVVFNAIERLTVAFTLAPGA